MPIQSAVTTPVFLASLVANAIAGISSPQMASGLAIGLEIYASSGLKAGTINVGTLGVGSGLGQGFFVSPAAFSAAFSASFAAFGILGVMAPMKINALSIAFSQCFSRASIVTISPTVGVGSGVVTAITNPAASLSAFATGMSAAGMHGVSMVQLVSAVSVGLDQGLLSGIGSVAIVGPPSIAPGSGPGIGIFS